MYYLLKGGPGSGPIAGKKRGPYKKTKNKSEENVKKEVVKQAIIERMSFADKYPDTPESRERAREIFTKSTYNRNFFVSEMDRIKGNNQLIAGILSSIGNKEQFVNEYGANTYAWSPLGEKATSKNSSSDTLSMTNAITSVMDEEITADFLHENKKLFVNDNNLTYDKLSSEQIVKMRIVNSIANFGPNAELRAEARNMILDSDNGTLLFQDTNGTKLGRIPNSSVREFMYKLKSSVEDFTPEEIVSLNRALNFPEYEIKDVKMRGNNPLKPDSDAVSKKSIHEDLIMHQWQTNSSSNTVVYTHSAINALGLSESDGKTYREQTYGSIVRNPSDYFKNNVKQIYDRTQERLGNKKVTATLHRGIGSSVKYTSTLASYSKKKTIAKRFGSYVTSEKFPRKRVFASFETNPEQWFDFVSENEYIIIDG